MRMFRRSLQYLFLIFASLIAIFPFIWMMISTTNSSVEISKGKFTLGNQLMINIQNVFETANVGTAFWNSLKIAIFGTLLSLFVSSLAAYGFQMYQSKNKEKIYGAYLLSMMIPFAALMIPLFKMMSNGINQVMSVTNGGDLLARNLVHLSIILPSVVSVFMVLFFRQSFQAFPKELMEAARLDGLREFAIFIKIVFPSMKSTYAAAAIYLFMGSWNNYLWPLLMVKDSSQRTLPLLVSTLASSYSPDFGVMMVSIVISTLPMIILFFALQKHFVQGMVGSVK